MKIVLYHQFMSSEIGLEISGLFVLTSIQFETYWEFTPFGEILLNKNDFSQSKTQVANFVRYQDGWRLE